MEKLVGTVFDQVENLRLSMLFVCLNNFADVESLINLNE